MGSADEGVEHLDAIVIGAGYSGIYLLHALRKKGFRTKLYEATDGLGGVWNVNDYPGARTDVDIPFYQLDIEEVWRNWTWKESFPSQPELREYFKFVDEKLKISKDVHFNTRVQTADYDVDAEEWVVTTSSGLIGRARFLLPCLGYGTDPYVPAIKGLDTFEGKSFHSTAWPHGLDVRGKRLGIIGTGATGVQLIQELGPSVESLTVFQRQINTAMPSRLRDLTQAEQDESKSDDSLRKILQGRPATFAGTASKDIPKSAMDVSEKEREATFEAAWARGGFYVLTDTFQDILLSQDSNTELYKFWRKKVAERVKSPKTLMKLAPEKKPYPIFARRASLETHYYEIFNQPNVDLIDVNEDPIQEVTPTGVRTSSGLHELDVLVLATGFDAVGGGLGSIQITGLDKTTTLSKLWANGKSTFLGMAISGYPNFLFSYGPQSPGGWCAGPACAQYQGDWIANALQFVRERGKKRIDPVKAAEQAWSDQTKAIAGFTLLPQAKTWHFGTNIPGAPLRRFSFWVGWARILRDSRKWRPVGMKVS